MLRKLKLMLGALSVAAFTAGCGGGANDPDVVQLAQSNPDLSILVEAVSAAGLVNTLPDGPWRSCPTRWDFQPSCLRGCPRHQPFPPQC